MSRFVGLTNNLNFFSGKLNQKLKVVVNLDFGSSQTRLKMDHKLVWDQPTLLAWHTHLQSVVAIGDKAAKLVGKTPAHIQLIDPIREGVVAELDYATYYLTAILATLRRRRQLLPWTIIACRATLPIGASPLEKEQLQQVLIQAGFKVKKIMSQPKAVVSSPPFRRITQSHGIIIFGAQVVDLGIFVGRQLFKGITLTNVVGDTFTQIVVEQVLASYELQLSWHEAEQIKKQLSTSSVMTVRGKDKQTQLIRVVKVEAKIFKDQFYSLATDLLLELKEEIDGLPPEIMMQLQQQGFYLTGGGSMLPVWSDLIGKLWQMPVIKATTPLLDVVKGLAHAS